MHALHQQVGKRVIHRALSSHAAQPREGGRLDLHGEVAFTAIRIVAAMATMFLTVVNDLEMRRSECLLKTSGDFRGHWTG